MLLLLLSDLEQMGQSVLNEFNRSVAHFGATESHDFERQVQRLEAKLEQLYAVAATMARRETELNNVADIWARMVSISDAIAQAVADLQKKQPAKAVSFDRILDIRNECEENRALHA